MNGAGQIGWRHCLFYSSIETIERVGQGPSLGSSHTTGMFALSAFLFVEEGCALIHLKR